jgi:hypothetical protein
MTKTIYTIVGLLFAAPSLFFIYYTVRLIYVNLAMSPDEAAAHRTGGMLIGVIAFPVAAIIFGLISWFCFSKGLKRTN